MTCCCQGEIGHCGCPAGVELPSYFNISFSGFTFTLASTASGSPPSTSSILKNYIEGLSPLILPRSQTATGFAYQRFNCSEYKTAQECQQIPPGFFSQQQAGFGGLLSSMRFEIACGGNRATASTQWIGGGFGVCWKIEARTNDFTTRLQVVLTFSTQCRAFSFSNICQIESAQTAVTVNPSVAGGTFLNTPQYWGYYTGSGTVHFEPVYNQLP